MFSKHEAISFGLALLAGIIITVLMIWIAMETTQSENSGIHESSYLTGTPSQGSEFDTKAADTVQMVSIDTILTDDAGICALTLNNNSRESLSVAANSFMFANGCDIHANSSSQSSITLASGAKIKANYISTNGKFTGNIKNFKPRPTVAMTPMGDPLANRNPPEFGKCDVRNLIIKPGANRLKPGVYCGGIVALRTSEIILEPGNYIIKNGPLIIGNKSTIIGKHVGFYFTGNNSEFSFGFATKVNLSAPIDGEMAGILFFENPEATSNRDFVLRSNNVEVLEGAIYLPKGRMVFDGADLTSATSGWTTVIANGIEVKNGAKVHLNSDYSRSNIPVPQGIWPSVNTAQLTN